MKIYRYHNGAVNVCRERKNWVAKLRASSLFFLFRRPILPLLIPDYITCMVTMETIRGWKEKNVSLLAARCHPYHFLVPMLICRKTVPGGHDIVSLDTHTGSYLCRMR